MNLLSGVAHQGRPGRTAAPPPPSGLLPPPPTSPPPERTHTEVRQRSRTAAAGPPPTRTLPSPWFPPSTRRQGVSDAGGWHCRPLGAGSAPYLRGSAPSPAVSLRRWCASRASQGGQWPDPALRQPDLVLHRPMRPALGRHASTVGAPTWPATSRASAAARGRQAQLRRCVGDNEGPAMRVAWRAQWAGSSRSWRRCYIFREPLAVCRRRALAAPVCSVTPLSFVNGAGSAGR